MRPGCYVLTILFLSNVQLIQAQYLMDMVDTTTDMGKGMLSIYKKFDRIRIGGYIQPQFQTASSKGAKSFEGGDFPANVNNRIMLRRGRIRFDYVHFGEKTAPSVQFVFQFDGTERGVFIRDFWGRVFENRYQLFSVTTGMFARPFGFETNLSSSDRESPERGRMNQLLMKTERDMGVMLSLDSRNKTHRLQYLKIDVGIFNGEGLASPADFDSHKDLITRIALKPYPLAKNITLSAAASYLNGGFLQNTQYVYRIGSSNSGKIFMIDSSAKNLGAIAPRKYYGLDAQLKIKNKTGQTELRGEVITGTQTATLFSSETPSALLTGTNAHYIRHFNGAYFYLLQTIFNLHHQVGVKLDWYDPDSEVNANDIGKTGTNLNATDIKYTTVGFGYIDYINDNLKLLIWYDKVINEKTQFADYRNDVSDDIMTIRLQFRF